MCCVRPVRNDGRVSWSQIVLATLFAWLAFALLVGAVVGHGIALGEDDPA